MSEGLCFRPVERSDMASVIKLLQAISSFIPPRDSYEAIWERFAAQRNLIALVADADGLIVGYAAMVLETKIRGGVMGHLEDVVIAETWRGRGLGQELLRQLIAASGCMYKVSLACEEAKIPFYERVGFSRGLVEMKLFPNVIAPP